MIPVNLFRIVVASPSDVQAEREAVEEVVKQVNHDLALDRRIVMRVFALGDRFVPRVPPEGPRPCSTRSSA